MITVPVDPRTPAIDTARAVLTGRPEPYAAGVTVAGQWPTSAAPGDAQPLPLVLVHIDGQAVAWPHTQRPNYRFQCYHADTDQALDLAALLAGLLLDGPPGPLQQPVLVVAPFTARDANRGEYGTFTVAASLLPGDVPRVTP